MKIAVLGGGSFGTVVANLVAENGHSVSLWARREDTATLMQKERVNQRYHPNHRLHDHISVTSDLKQVCLRWRNCYSLLFLRTLIKNLQSWSVL